MARSAPCHVPNDQASLAPTGQVSTPITREATGTKATSVPGASPDRTVWASMSNRSGPAILWTRAPSTKAFSLAGDPSVHLASPTLPHATVKPLRAAVGPTRGCVMPAATKTLKMSLVTVIASSELQDRLVEDLRTAGAKGYTVSQAGGGGLHGSRKRSVWDTGNVRIETLLSADASTRLLATLERDYEGQSLIAFVHEVMAMPREHFVAKKG